MFNNVTTALLTPFKNDKIDFCSFEKLLHFQLQGGVENLVVLGTTAESTLLTQKEKKQLLNFAVKNTRNKAKIIAGVGVPSTAETVRNALEAVKSGVDALLVVSPYYTKSTAEGLEAHFEAVKNATKLPVIAYNVKHRTGCDIPVPTLVNLLKNRKIDGLKEANDSPARLKAIVKNCPELQIFCGNDSALSAFLEHKNTVGLISVLSNCLPKISVGAFNRIESDAAVFKEFSDALTIEVSPVAAKYLAFKLKLLTTAEMRLPLTSLSPDKQKLIDALVEKFDGGFLR